MSSELKLYNDRMVAGIIAGSSRNFQEELRFIRPGNSIDVHVWIIDGTTRRVQRFSGLCIAIRKRHHDSNFTFTVRHGSGNFSVEKKYEFYSKIIVKIELIKAGLVRRAKLYYLRDREGKRAKIEENRNFNSVKNSKKNVAS